MVGEEKWCDPCLWWFNFRVKRDKKRCVTLYILYIDWFWSVWWFGVSERRAEVGVWLGVAEYRAEVGVWFGVVSAGRRSAWFGVAERRAEGGAVEDKG